MEYDNVPLKTTSKYALPDMKVGESKLFEGQFNSSVITCGISYWLKKEQPTWKVSARTQVNGVRVWRIK